MEATVRSSIVSAGAVDSGGVAGEPMEWGEDVEDVEDVEEGDGGDWAAPSAAVSGPHEDCGGIS